MMARIKKSTRMKEQLGKWDRALIAAKLSAHAYKSEKAAAVSYTHLTLPTKA